MNKEFSSKQEQIKNLFAHCTTKEDKYEKIIELGRNLSSLDPIHHIEKNKVAGCQSTLYLHSYLQNGKIYFCASSDALISAGLASLMLMAYSGQPLETVLKCPPTFLEELNIHNMISPSRSNGLSSLFLRMKQDAIAHLLQMQN